MKITLEEKINTSRRFKLIFDEIFLPLPYPTVIALFKL